MLVGVDNVGGSLHRANRVERIRERGSVLGDTLAFAGGKRHAFRVNLGKVSIISATSESNIALGRVHNGLEKASSGFGGGGGKVDASFQDHGAHCDVYIKNRGCLMR